MAVLESYTGSVAIPTYSGITAMNYEIEIRNGGVYFRGGVGSTNYYVASVTLEYAGGTYTFTCDEYGCFSVVGEHQRIFSYVNNRYQITITGKNKDGYALKFRDVNDSSAPQYTKWVLGEDNPNRLPEASISVPVLYAGKTARITWSTYDADGDTVYTTSLIRYMRKQGETTFSHKETLISSETTGTSYTDTIPSDAGGAEIYYYLGFTDKIGGTQYKQSATKTVSSNTAPTAPGSILVSGDVSGSVAAGGGNVVISWASASDADGNLAGYELEKQENGGNWGQIYKGSAREYSTVVTDGTSTIRYRVRAYDTMGATSGYTYSTAYTVNNNKAPVIAIGNIVTDGNIGVYKNAAPAVSYTVTDPEGTQMVVEEYLDGVLLRRETAVSGAARTISFTDDAWIRVLNGEHTLRITAVDADGSVGAAEVKFTKDVDRIEILLKSAMESDSADAPQLIMVNVQGLIPAGAILKVWAANNANDASPVWEDISSAVLGREKHIFTNTTKTADKWAVNVRVILERGDAESVCAITSVGGNWK